MIQGLGYFLTHNTLGAEQQLKIITESVQALRQIGLIPLVLVMDQFATNIKMTNIAGASINKPYIEIEGKRVYIMWDSPHLIKSARNMLKKHNAIFEDKIACFEDIISLYNVDSVSNPRLVPRLSEKHITVPPFSSMNVSLATRTLSQSVANGLRYYANAGELPTRCLDTAEFIEFHDKLFDIFNSKSHDCSIKVSISHMVIHIAYIWI